MQKPPDFYTRKNIQLARPGWFNPFERYGYMRGQDDSPDHKAMTAYIELQRPLIEARRREAQAQSE
jgi:hypothetical protein